MESAYRSAVVLVKFPLLPLALIWLLPKDMMDPRLSGTTPVPLPPIVDAPTLTTEPVEPVVMTILKLSTMLDPSTVKKTWVACPDTPARACKCSRASSQEEPQVCHTRKPSVIARFIKHGGPRVR
jgi:hypothetical protein